MLPLVSSTMPRLTGTRSALKCVTVYRLVVFVDDEVFLAEPGDEAAAGVGDRRRDVDQLDAALEAESSAGSVGGCCAPGVASAAATAMAKAPAVRVLLPMGVFFAGPTSARHRRAARYRAPCGS